MEQNTIANMMAREGKPEKQRRLPRLFRLDDTILTQMLFSKRPIIGVSKSILKTMSSGKQATATTAVEGEECFFFHAAWQAVC